MMTQDQIQGSWDLLSWDIFYAENQVAQPFGESPSGLLIYSDDGYMSAQLSSRHRPTLSGTSMRKLEESQRRQLLESFFAYTGTYSVLDDRIIHHVTQSLNPDFIGHDQVRLAALEGDVLTLTGFENDGHGNERKHVLNWKRMKRSKS